MIDKLISISIERNKPLKIIYQSKKGITQRTIRVISIQGNMIRAYCYAKGQYRNFYKDRILAAEVDYRYNIKSRGQLMSN
jgi:predicted DNA-binding transcriptional regulator YafY